MFRHSRHAALGQFAPTARAARAAMAISSSTASPRNRSTSTYDVGVRQALDEHKGIGALAGVIMLCVGGAMIASEHRHGVPPRPAAGWSCTPAGCEGNPVVEVAAGASPEDVQMALSVLKNVDLTAEVRPVVVFGVQLDAQPAAATAAAPQCVE